MRRVISMLMLAVACGWCVCPPAYTADSPAKPVVAKTVKATPPANITDLLAQCEADRQAIASADAAIADANATLKSATDAKGAAQLAATNDYAAFLQLWSTLYSTGPAPPAPAPVPTPTPTPVPPTPPTPTPPVVHTTLTLITATGTWCAACTQLEADTMPGLRTELGDRLTVVDYTSAAAKTLYPESALVPRWVLTWPDGTKEKKIGYLTTDQLNAWLKGAMK